MTPLQILLLMISHPQLLPLHLKISLTKILQIHLMLEVHLSLHLCSIHLCSQQASYGYEREDRIFKPKVLMAEYLEVEPPNVKEPNVKEAIDCDH